MRLYIFEATTEETEFASAMVLVLEETEEEALKMAQAKVGPTCWTLKGEPPTIVEEGSPHIEEFWL